MIIVFRVSGGTSLLCSLSRTCPAVVVTRSPWWFHTSCFQDSCVHTTCSFHPLLVLYLVHCHLIWWTLSRHLPRPLSQWRTHWFWIFDSVRKHFRIESSWVHLSSKPTGFQQVELVAERRSPHLPHLFIAHYLHRNHMVPFYSCFMWSEHEGW